MKAFLLVTLTALPLLSCTTNPFTTTAEVAAPIAVEATPPAVIPEAQVRPAPVVVAPTPRPVPKVVAVGLPSTTVTIHHSGGCGSRGGPGYRLPNGKCASWHHKH